MSNREFETTAPTGSIEALEDEQRGIMAQLRAIEAEAESEDRELSADNVAEMTTLQARFAEIEAQLKAKKLRAEMEAQLEKSEAMRKASRGRKVEPSEPKAKAPAVQNRPTGLSSSRKEIMGRFGFDSLPQWLCAVRDSAYGQVTQATRILADSASTYGQEAVGADGGYSVPPTFANEIMKTTFDQDPIISRTNRMSVMGNTITIPTDEETPWSSGGIQAYFTSEGSSLTATKPDLNQVNLSLDKLTCLVNLTEELLEDGVGMSSYVQNVMAERLNWKIADKIVNGSGTGEPQGILGSQGTVTQSKDSSQAAATVSVNNLSNMLSKLAAPSAGSAVWLIHPSVISQLIPLKLGDQPVFMPGGNVAGSPFGMLFGMPLIQHEACAVLGSKGDIILADFSQYLTVTKNPMTRTATSMHAYFVQDIMSFRFVVRFGGQPWRSKVIASAHGTHNTSPFVTLAARS